VKASLFHETELSQRLSAMLPQHMITMATPESCGIECGAGNCRSVWRGNPKRAYVRYAKFYA